MENAYRVHLGWALSRARAAAGEADDPFAVTRRAMEADAWGGGESAGFYQQCMQHGSSAATAADESMRQSLSRSVADQLLQNDY